MNFKIFNLVIINILSDLFNRDGWEWIGLSPQLFFNSFNMFLVNMTVPAIMNKFISLQSAVFGD